MNQQLTIDKEAHEKLLHEAERRRQLKALETAEANQDRRRTKIPTAEIVADKVKDLEDLARRSMERRKRLEDYVRGLKTKTKPCEKHGDLRGIDVDQMSRDSVGEDWKIRFKPCQKCDVESRGEWLRKVGVPVNLLHATLDNWNAGNQAARLAQFTCKQFVQRARGFLVITNSSESPSKFGIGKSHLAVGILREIGTGRFLTQSDLMMKIRRRYNDRYQEDILEAAIRARCLVLDELGVGPGGDDELPSLYTLIGERYNRDAPTIITTNLTQEEMFQYLGGRLESRLEAGIWKVVELNGTNQRKRA